MINALLLSTPFILILLTIAFGPLLFPNLWEKNSHKALIIAILTLPILGYLIIKEPNALSHSLHDYGSFIIFLSALFIICGGISLEGDLEAKPITNTFFLGLGAILANLIGTTGASMLLIRPLLQTNQERKHIKHIPIFFIFIVSNIGGLLTPIGDPPLFMGYLKGVPFFWTLKLFPIWFLANGFLLILFFIIDSYAHKKETKKDLALDHRQIKPLKLRGTFQLLLIFGVVLGVFLPSPSRELLMIVLCFISLRKNVKKIRQHNQFTFHPIIEVAILFAGIFIAIVPLLQILETHGSKLGITTPMSFYWLTGTLSAVLDNTPTYLSFFFLAQGLHLPGENIVGMPTNILLAISASAVMMGALTYIGNGPNFMVKAIADERKIKMPSFFGYIIYSVGILVPLFIVISFLFF